MGYYDYKLWCDMKTDQDRVEFILSSRAWETSIISRAIVEDVAAAFRDRAIADMVDLREVEKE